MRATYWRLLFIKYSPTSFGTCTSKVGFLPASAWSSMHVSICNAMDSTILTLPRPMQRGQISVVDSRIEGRSRCRDISRRPKREIRANCTRALSVWQEVRNSSSTCWPCLRFAMSIKSITIRPPMSRMRSCRAISLAASILVSRAVSSICFFPVDREELTSMDVSASVGSKTMAPPEGKRISRS